MRSEPIPFRLRATIGLLAVLMFVTLALLRSALLGGRSAFDFARESSFLYVVTANLLGLAWGFWVAFHQKTPSDIRIIFVLV